MNRFFVLLTILLVGNGIDAQEETRPPNIVVIMADDCTFRDIGCYGGQATTPSIDRIATEGLLFENCFQAAPMCSPTRHNLYTGLYPVRSGAYPNHAFAKPGTKSVVHYLKELGYRVALSGKRHIAPRSVFPFEYSGKKNPDMAAIEKLFRECKTADKPFCLFACSNEPHSPWNKGDASRYPVGDLKLPPYMGDTPIVRENFSRYLAEISYFDQQVGQLDQLLKKHQLDKETIFVVLSEQGNGFPFAKWTCYGNGLQSAMLIRWPGKIKKGSRTAALVEYVDLLPTLIEAAGGIVPEKLEGKSLLKLFRGQTASHKSHVFGLMTTRGIINGTSIFPIRTVRDARYRLVWNLNHKTTFTNACTQSSHFLSVVASASQGNKHAKNIVDRYQHRPEFELFDCQQDPLELTNLAEDPTYSEIRSELKKKLDAWMQEQGDLGRQTEIEAILHQQKHAGKSPETVFRQWEKNRKGK